MAFERQRMTRKIPVIGAAVAGSSIAATAMLVPTRALEAAVWSTGLAALVPAAAPPLGVTARLVLALGGGLVAAAIAWAALYLLFGPGGVWARTVATEAQPSVRWADAHPDAPPRRPVSFADLGPPAPPAPPPVEQPLPADLEQPLAAFDPHALPPVPLAPSQPLPPLAPARMAPPLEAGERIETFDLNHRDRDAAQPSIEDLLRRLEQGAARRPARTD